MKRDFELVRKLLLFFEETCDDSRPIDEPLIVGYEMSVIQKHIYLLYQADFVFGVEVGDVEVSREVFVQGLTWTGHEFLDQIRTEFIWNQVQEEIRSKGFTSASFDMIRRVADRLIRKRLEF